MTIEYNEKNLKMVSDAIYNNLSDDMLPKKWIERNKTNPMFGHCHTASGCLQKIFGTKTIKMHRALDDENIYHWWCVDINGTVIDFQQSNTLILIEILLMKTEQKWEC